MSGQQCEFVHPLGFQCDLEPSHIGMHEAKRKFSINTNTDALTVISWILP